MSLLVKIELEDRIVDGTLRKIGDVVRLPNSLAVHLRKKGFISYADGEAHAKEAAVKVATRKAREKLETKSGKRAVA